MTLDPYPALSHVHFLIKFLASVKKLFNFVILFLISIRECFKIFRIMFVYTIKVAALKYIHKHHRYKCKGKGQEPRSME